MYRRLIILAAIVGIGLFVTNAMAVIFYWYVSIPWFDMFMHTIGGVFTALVGTAFLLPRLKGLRPMELFITISLFVFIIGLFWEYYEYIVQFYIKSVQLANISDSISDLICDMVGGSIGAFFVILLNKRYNKE